MCELLFENCNFDRSYRVYGSWTAKIVDGHVTCVWSCVREKCSLGHVDRHDPSPANVQRHPLVSLRRSIMRHEKSGRSPWKTICISSICCPSLYYLHEMESWHDV